MRVFVTGATGFIGSALVPELIGAGHQVLGLTRSEEGAQSLLAAGAEVHRGNLEDLESLRAGAAASDSVIHCAFDHDFSNFAANCEKDRRVIEAIGDALVGSDRPLLITSGTGMGGGVPGQTATEDRFDLSHPNPRIASEEAGMAVASRGVNVSVVRLPQVHDPVKQGLITPLIQVTREKGVSAYVGAGGNRWPAAHVLDVARLYRLALEKGEAGSRYNAVAEEGNLGTRDRGSHRQGVEHADRQPVPGGSDGTLRMARHVRRSGHACLQRVDAGAVEMASHRPWTDRRSRTDALARRLRMHTRRKLCFFIAGITGHVGGAAARQLLEEGHAVRTLARDPQKAAEWAQKDVDVRQGDFTDPIAVAAALEGVEGAYLMMPPIMVPSPGYPEAKAVIASFGKALRQSPPPRLALLSSVGSEKSSGLGNITTTHLMEQALGDLPFPTAFVPGRRVF